jgi:hypothetical protein
MSRCLNSSIGPSKILLRLKITAPSMKFSAYIPWPVPTDQLFQRSFRHCVDAFMHLATVLLPKVLHKQRNVLSPLTQGRDANRKNIKTVVQVTPKFSSSHHPL